MLLRNIQMNKRMRNLIRMEQLILTVTIGIQNRFKVKKKMKLLSSKMTISSNSLKLFAPYRLSALIGPYRSYLSLTEVKPLGD